MQPAKLPHEQAPIKKLGPDDVLVQKRITLPRNVDVDQANRVPDPNWEIGHGRGPGGKASQKTGLSSETSAAQ